MKHTSIFVAAALLAAAGAASAQSSVNIYGRFNVTGERQKTTVGTRDVTTYQLADNSSRIGFKGTEDLGGGLRAGFILEHGFDASRGVAASSAFWGRQSEVNLSGGFGMLRAGNFTPESYYATSDYIGFHNHETGSSSDALYAGIGFVLGRTGNKIAYRTPEFIKGLTAEAAVSANENSPQRVRVWDFALNYGAGPLHLGVGYEKAADKNQYAVSGTYEAGPLLFGVMVQRDKNVYGPGSRTNARGSVAYTLGGSEFHFNYGKANDYSKLANSGATQATLGYNYNLSKRTKLYTYYTKINAEKATPYASDFSSIAFGMRHNF